jgi:hypothetical protein
MKANISTAGDFGLAETHSYAEKRYKKDNTAREVVSQYDKIHLK